MDSNNPIVRKNSEEALNQELALAMHFGLSGITFKLMSGIDKNMNLARIICDKLTNNCVYQVNFLSLNYKTLIRGLIEIIQ